MIDGKFRKKNREKHVLSVRKDNSRLNIYVGPSVWSKQNKLYRRESTTTWALACAQA